MMHICVSKLAINGSDDGLSLGRHQAISWTNAGIPLIGPLGTNLSEISSNIHFHAIKRNKCKKWNQNVVWEMTAILSRPQRIKCDIWPLLYIFVHAAITKCTKVNGHWGNLSLSIRGEMSHRKILWSLEGAWLAVEIHFDTRRGLRAAKVPDRLYNNGLTLK